MFIVFEGLDGSGTTTQAIRLKQHLESVGKKVVRTEEPTNFVIGKLIREYLQHNQSTSHKALQLLFAADREDHLHRLIRPSLKEGSVVVSDRYFFSSIAFGALGDVKFEWFEDLYKTFEMPDHVFLFKVAPEICVERIHSRGHKIELFEKLDTLEKVWQNYERISKIYDCVRIIDGTKSIEAIGDEVMKIINESV